MYGSNEVDVVYSHISIIFYDNEWYFEDVIDNDESVNNI